ncbi:MAG: aspartate aminotransferase family protein [Anaerolineales bacterium]|nr:aspartate aminotransferase family protein [Anaerolineales bacterium]
MTDNTEFLNMMKEIHDLLAPSLAEDWPELPVERAQGAYLYLADGRRILDFTSGIGVTNIGHNHPRVMEAARKQMEAMLHSAVGITIHQSLLELCHALIDVLPSGLDMFFFGNSGAEAVEGAIKMARYVTQRPGIIAFEGGFHGRTYGAASVTTVKAKYRDHYEPFVPGIYFAPYPYTYRCPFGTSPEAALEWTMYHIEKLFQHQILPHNVAAFLVEPVQGEGGYIVPPPDFLKALRQICDQHGILLILDEVQCGFGRTGQMFAAQTFGVKPDILAVAKSIASGFPLGATVASRDLMSQWKAGSHGTTFGGNPMSCAAGLATLQVMREENVLENCRQQGQRFLEGLQALQKKYSIIGEARGLGCMLAIEMIVPGSDKQPNPQAAMQTLNLCLDNGLLAYMAGTYGQVVRFIPPLIVSSTQIDEALAVLEKVLAQVSRR